MSEVRTFLRTKGATVPDYNVSLASLFTTVASEGITTPGGNTSAPHAMSEFYGMNYSTTPPGTPVITLLGESEINLEPGDALPPHIDGIGPDDITINISEEDEGGGEPSTFAGTTWFLINGTYLGQPMAGSRGDHTLWSSPGGFNGHRLNFHPTIRQFPTAPASCSGGFYTPPATRYPPNASSACAAGNNSFVGSPFITHFYGQVTFNNDGTYYVWCADKEEKSYAVGDHSGTYTQDSSGITITIPKGETATGTQTMTILGDPGEAELLCTNIYRFAYPTAILSGIVAIKLTEADKLAKPENSYSALKWNDTNVNMPNNGTDVITT